MPNAQGTTTNSEPESPCVSQCCLDDSDICVGCFRHLDEITGWRQSTSKDKHAILARCQTRRETNAARYK